MNTRDHALAVLAWVLTGLCLPATAQQPSDWTAEPRENTPRWHALTGVTLVAAPGRLIPEATVVLRDGRIVAAGAGVPVPAGARVWPLPGRRVQAGFIDLAASVGVPAPLRAPAPARPMFGPGSELPPPSGPRPDVRPPVARGLAARNPHVRAEQDVAAQLEWRPDEARSLRELGFALALATPANGVWRGQGALLALGAVEAPQARAQVVTPRASQHLAMEAPPRGDFNYPVSTMGAVALARQSLLDARWYRSATAQPGAERVEPNDSLAALAAVLEGRQPVFAVADDEQDYGRIARLRDEFGLRRLVVQGNGHEYRRAAQLEAWQLPLLLPLNFPAPPDLQDPDSALDVPLATLQHWEQAPSNPAQLHRAGVPFAITTAGLREPAREFWPRLRQAVQRGLPADAALAALTTQPAALLGESARLGTVEPGRAAHLVVSRGDLFTEEDAAIELLFIDGRPVRPEAAERGDPRGEWLVDGLGTLLRIAGTRQAPRLEGDTPAQRCPLQVQGRDWVLRQPCASAEGQVIVAALQPDGRWLGSTQSAGGAWSPWSATRRAPFAAAAAAAASAPPVPGPPAATYPAGAYGITTPPRPAVLLLRNATLWTQGPAGRLEGADLLLREGRIAAIGRQLAAPAGAEVIDAGGRHVTPGLIDAHSHIAVSGGINEFSNSIASEVRISDALDPTDITIYRQLAGGLTAANVLHGSANTIGGQSQLIKLRWGSDGAGLVFEGARPSIKFALGENPRSANFGSRGRYPATRMGVEQVLRDGFAAAREYAAQWRDWRQSPQGRPEPRRDLRLEALVELFERRRVIHVHSYRADEILMFSHFARDNGLEVAAFQHVLEGYKVAGAIAAIGAGASSFSDWWGYKMEVIDAVPHNAALMQRAGVLSSINSDDAEMGRRLAHEAAKSVRDGGLSEEQALALVTLNPARQLGVAERVGSLEVGKDADFVLWSGPPLSAYSRVEQTWIDGRRYFDRETDQRLREQARSERQRLVAAALKAPRPGPGGAGEGQPAPRPPAGHQRIATSELGLLGWLDAARALRGLYATQDAWHECTEDGGFTGAHFGRYFQTEAGTGFQAEGAGR